MTCSNSGSMWCCVPDEDMAEHKIQLQLAERGLRERLTDPHLGENAVGHLEGCLDAVLDELDEHDREIGFRFHARSMSAGGVDR